MLRKHVIGPGGKRVLAFEPESNAERAQMKADKVPIASDLVAAREAEVQPARRSTPKPAPSGN